ncbi:MAG: dTMP kinase [Desulfuromonadales bacterium]|nr:dTMP kinase [Desulfuromonadales bacterium]MDT8422185.1 dTMP kinase [Desulfuromonadales bacterium]
MPFFITFEGSEGCGKTTQSQHLAEHLRASGYSVLTTREPGGCVISDAIRSILLDAANTALTQRSELLLYAAARAQHVDEIIRPALATGTIVICDRYIDATVAYQGHGRGLDLDLIGDLNRLATNSVVPDLTLLLDFPVEAGLQRARARNAQAEGDNEDRFERESLAFHHRVRQGYLQLAAQHKRFQIIAAEGSPARIAGRIRQVVDNVISTRETP